MRPPKTQNVSLMNYDAIVDMMSWGKILDLPGNIVEIGAFMGVGTAKMAAWLEKSKSDKKIYVLDIFDLNFDKSVNDLGGVLTDVYSYFLADGDLTAIFKANTRGYENIVVIEGDSRVAKLRIKSVCFGIVDGCHDPEWVENDLDLIWSRLVPGGLICIHDYKTDFESVTAVIDEFVEGNGVEIDHVYHEPAAGTLYLRRGSNIPPEGPTDDPEDTDEKEGDSPGDDGENGDAPEKSDSKK